MAPKKSSANQNTSSSTPKKPVRPQQKRDTKHGGRNGKKDGVSGSSVFTWFIVIALLGVWTSVAVVWFDLVDYEDVLAKAKDFRYNLSEVLQGKLDAYDADGDGDFDVDDAKILLGLKERSVQPSEDSDHGRDEPADPGYISDQDLADALTDDESDHTDDYISDQDLADVLEDDYVSESLHEHEIDDQDLEELVHRETQPLYESVEDFDLEDALDDKTDETSDVSDDFNLEDAIDSTVHGSLHHEYEGQHETLEEGDIDVEVVNLDTEESARLFDPIVENIMETLTIEVPDEELEVEFRRTEATTELEDEPALETAELPDLVEAEEEVEELWHDFAEDTEIEDEPTAIEETIYEDDAEETVAENPEPEEHVAEESQAEFTANIPETEELVNEDDDVDDEEEPNPEIVEDDHVYHEEETNPSDLEETLYDYAHETEQGDEQLQHSDEQIENEPREIKEEIVVEEIVVKPNDHAQEENTLVPEEEEEQSDT